ncbi:LysM and BON domain-containing protein [Azospirillum picis]|uniref:Nucleoid-associated protein YgaU n=1 Tax=Azospirillum picis TaxID=488438 RepID=A0ABU0MT09_9PROT|nr:LysM and BON domain-containing protein [Azospirillum picis]MBP2302872.1 nucleoid-associated protein YgaU [Azospirillum picis]MDQ0536623.1 nucleoid-associated protein YgaU [Azospirillum picis]
MGLFDFFRRDAGPKVGGESPTPDALRQHLNQLGISTNGLDIAVDGDTVTVRGAAPSQDQREKIVIALGNVHGIGKVEDQLGVSAANGGGEAAAPVDGGGGAPANAPAPENPASQFYTVQSGDTLSKISKHFYHDANKYSAIFEANRPMLKDPDEIYPGQVLRIPPGA